jgi:hypothetical protein
VWNVVITLEREVVLAKGEIKKGTFLAIPNVKNYIYRALSNRVLY